MLQECSAVDCSRTLCTEGGRRIVWKRGVLVVRSRPGFLLGCIDCITCHNHEASIHRDDELYDMTPGRDPSSFQVESFAALRPVVLHSIRHYDHGTTRQSNLLHASFKD